MNRFTKVLILIALIAQVLLLSIGCSNNSVTGKYYRDFGNYTSTSMYIELKKDQTFETDGTAPGLRMEGTYKISGSAISFTQDLFFSDGVETSSGTINGKTITIDGAAYIK